MEKEAYYIMLNQKFPVHFLSYFFSFVVFLSLQAYWKSGSVGRVARQRSAKPRTAVRIRHRPQKKVQLFALFFISSALFGDLINNQSPAIIPGSGIT